MKLVANYRLIHESPKLSCKLLGLLGITANHGRTALELAMQLVLDGDNEYVEPYAKRDSGSMGGACAARASTTRGATRRWRRSRCGLQGAAAAEGGAWRLAAVPVTSVRADLRPRTHGTN